MHTHSAARSSLGILGALIIVAACGSASVTNPPTTGPVTQPPAAATPTAAPASTPTTAPAATTTAGAAATSTAGPAATPTEVAATPTVPALTPPPLEPATLKLWVFQEGKKAFLNELIAEFEAANPGVKVDVTAYPEAQYSLKIQTAIAAGAAPDLAHVGGPDQMRTGIFLPLDDMIAAYGIDLSTFAQSIVTGNDDFSCNWDGKLYCIGSDLGAVLTFYNKDMFAAANIPNPAVWPPMSVDEFVADACKLRDSANNVWGAAYGFTILPWETIFSADGRTTIGVVNSPQSVSDYGLLAKGITDGCAPSANLVDPWEQGADLFSQGQLAMVVTDFLSLKQIEDAGINYGVMAPPTPPGVEPYFDTYSDNLGVFKSSAYPVQGKAFLAFLATRGQELQVSINGNFPIDTAVAERLNWAQDIPGRLEGEEVLGHARPSVFVPNKWDVISAFYDATNLMAGGEAEAQQALDDAAPKIQTDLDTAWQNWDAGPQ